MAWPDWGSGSGDTGTPTIVGTGTSESSGLSPQGTWTTPGNITTDSAGTDATVFLYVYGNYYSFYLFGMDCGFSVPASAEVVGFEMILNMKQDSTWPGNMQGQRESIVVGGVIHGYIQRLFNLSGTSYSDYTRGGPTDMMGSGAGTITGANVNATNFGGAWMLNWGGYAGSNTCRVNDMTLRVYYTSDAKTPWGSALVYGLSALAALPAIGGLADRALAKLRPVHSQTRKARKLEFQHA
tara:strand:- start:167 stop:883 length:717 start_codon:yes stop_codon:yes gene_type:complete